VNDQKTVFAHIDKKAFEARDDKKSQDMEMSTLSNAERERKKVGSSKKSITKLLKQLSSSFMFPKIIGSYSVLE